MALVSRNRERYNEYMNDYMKERWYERRQQAIEVLGGRCVDCGTTENLEFDHIDPTKKEFTIASGSSFAWRRFWREVLKCQLLCGECHKYKHRSIAEHGTPQRYWCGCDCTPCRLANNGHSRVYKREWRRRR